MAFRIFCHVFVKLFFLIFYYFFVFRVTQFGTENCGARSFRSSCSNFSSQFLAFITAFNVPTFNSISHIAATLTYSEIEWNRDWSLAVNAQLHTDHYRQTNWVCVAVKQNYKNGNELNSRNIERLAFVLFGAQFCGAPIQRSVCRLLILEPKPRRHMKNE